jgi:hypothetical protein
MQYGMPYGNNYLTQQMPQIQMPPVEKHIDRVHGEAGVDQYQMAANSDTLLLDETAPIVWLVQTDAAGYKSKYPYDITPHKKEEPPNINSIDEKLNAFDSRLKALEEALK